MYVTPPSFRKPQSLDLPPSLDHLLGPMTALSVYQWYTARVDQILSQSGLFDHAAALLDLALERLVPVNIYKSVLKLIEEAVTQLNFEVTYIVFKFSQFSLSFIKKLL